MGKTAESRIFSSQYYFKLSLLCVAVFVPFLIFICFLTLGFSPFLVTTSILLASTILILTFSKIKVITIENPTQDDEVSMCSPKDSLVRKVERKLNPELEAVTLCNAAQQSEVNDDREYQVESIDFPSASESGDNFSESGNFELNWVSFNNVGKNVAVSECSFSSDNDEDEDDNLIEISFPDNNSVELNEEPEEKLQTEYSPESIFRQEGLMELLADINEVNEEDNLIEIDLSMGSIKGRSLDIEE
ncbi:hypothetical protein P3X46_027316 [Hevea brasiliensis]|uniref:Transmembrane protein n=1 Tax=Hevea brasiliensis TaxID=3981 RepID=A0ABQ9L106_HEVBR|nr:uncharacterized protein LOC131173913 [Hevea brasiliensis]KAJ9153929.1 hypothetical protein P3X46_027316 [Hevea brasiliensis]